MKINKRLSAAVLAFALALGLTAPPLGNVAFAAKTSVQEPVTPGRTETESVVSAAPTGLPDSEELERQYIEQLFYGGGISTYKDYGHNLDGATRQIYDQLRTEIEAIANGTKTKTSGITINWDTPFDDKEALANGIESAFNYLLVDLPADFYWCDKTVGFRYSYYPNDLTSAVMAFAVSENYSDGTTEVIGDKTYYTSVDPSRINAAKSAVSNAQEIASKYADLSTDYDKIVAFCEEICTLTSYNYDAAADDSTPYGDPWQLVWVFDKNENTKVVCEGYSKAFQYLCDLSGIECYTVTGVMAGGTGAGGHMWNIVVLDGKSYLVDITNCDGSSIGAPDKLLLKGASESFATGCKFTNLSAPLTYTYDTDLIYTSDILIVSTTDYPKPVPCDHEYDDKYGSDGENHWLLCIKCGAGKKDITAHTFGSWTGSEKTHDRVCEVCSYRDSAAHTGVSAGNAKEATCTEKGKEADTVCSVCNYLIKEGAEIPLAAHTAGEPVRENEIPATCTAEGSYDEVIKCTVCDTVISSEKKTIEKTPHTPAEPIRENEIPATCTAEGSYDEVIKCTVCGTVISSEKKTIDKIPHTPGEPVRENETQASCTETGAYDEVVRCTACNELISTVHRIIPAKGHNLDAAWSEDETGHWKECPDCGVKFSESAHTEDSSEVTIPPTETEDGERTYLCSVCGRKLRTETIPALGGNHVHEYTIQNSSESEHWSECTCGEIDSTTKSAHSPASKDEVITEPTCSGEGSKYVITSCSDCGRELGRTTASIPRTDAHTAGAEYAKDSSDHWKICTVCGTILDKEPHIAGPAATEETAQTCTVCGYEIAPVLAHTHTFDTAWSKDGSYHWHAATCAHTEEISGKAAHVWNAGEITTSPTETSKGVKTYTCTVCGAVKTESISEVTPTPAPEPAPAEVVKGVARGENTPNMTISTSQKELADFILTEAEKQQAANGTEIKIILDVKDAAATVSSEDKAAVKTALNGYKVGQYLDINLYKLIGENRSGVSETARKIRLTIAVPDSLKNSAKERTFGVVRIHNGQAEFLPDLDDSADTITIETDRFSTYAITYKDAGTTGGNGGSTGSSGGSGKSAESGTTQITSPQTGDTAGTAMYAVLFLIAGSAGIFLHFRKKTVR